MNNYYLENIRFGITSEGEACGPVSGNAVAVLEIKEKKESPSQWLSLVEVDGMANIYLTDKDCFEKQLKEDPDDKEFWEYMNSHSIESFDGIDLAADYDEIFDSIYKDKECEPSRLIRLLIAVVRADDIEANQLAKDGKGKWLSEVTIPVSDVEEDYLSLYI